MNNAGIARGRKKKWIVLVTLIVIIMLAGFSIILYLQKGPSLKSQYIVEYIENTTTFNYQDHWVINGPPGTAYISVPVYYSNITTIEFQLNWTSRAIMGGDSPSTVNLTLFESLNSTVVFIPSNSVQNMSSSNQGVKEGNITIVCQVNEIEDAISIYASTIEEALENTTLMNGYGNWYVNISGWASGIDWPPEIEWELNVTVYHLEGTITKQ
jgi:hypothetical protein